MTVVSVDLAYLDYRDIGIAALNSEPGRTECDFVTPSLRGTPDPRALADYLTELCLSRDARLLLLDGPQGWKDPDNGLQHCRLCERELNTPAKTGLPGSVKPANYSPYVEFSIALFDQLASFGWIRFQGTATSSQDTQFVAIESFPLSAWRSLQLPILPSKRVARAADIRDRAADLRNLFPLELSAVPNHDELQALVAGLAGICLEAGRDAAVKMSGAPPIERDDVWREGFIVNPTRPASIWPHAV